ncbi:MAG: YdcF family protein [Rhodospirillales bacterium]
MTGRRPIRRPQNRAYVVVGCLVLIAALFWIHGLREFAGSIPVDTADDGARTDAVVVLTGGSGRLDEGVGLLRAGRADMLFVSGVYEGIDVRYLLETVLSGDAGIEDRVEIGNATNTIGNAEETAAWIREKGYRSLRLVTAAYHMPRSLLEFEFVLDGVAIVPHPVFPEHVKSNWWEWPGSAVLVMKEYNKFLLAWVRQKAVWLRGAFPADG